MRSRAEQTATTRDAIGGLVLRQPARGYRFSMDALLLAAFACASAARPARVADYGAGSGVAGLLAARKLARAEVTLVELDAELHELCARNVEENALASRARAVHGDVRVHEPEEPYDLILCNPPYRKPGTGRMAEGAQRSRARHELFLTLDELAAAAARSLRSRGRLCIVYHPERLVEAFERLRAARLEPKRIRLVHGRAEMEARIVLIEAVKHGRTGLQAEPPLIVYADGPEESKQYTPEVERMYDEA